MIYDNEEIEIQQNLKCSDIVPMLDYAISLISNLTIHFNDAPLDVKTRLLGSIFNKGVEFDRKTYRTKDLNKVVELLCMKTNKLQKNENKKDPKMYSLGSLVLPMGLFSNQFLADLHKLYVMKRYIPDPTHTINPQEYHKKIQQEASNFLK